MAGEGRHLDDGVQLLPFQRNARKHHMESTNAPNIKSKDPESYLQDSKKQTSSNQKSKSASENYLITRSALASTFRGTA